MPQRFLRPGITNSERWNACAFPAQSLYVRLLTLVDDFGRCDGRAQVIWGACFSMRPDVKLQQVAVMLQQLALNNLIDWYEIEGKKVLQIVQWQERIREGCRPKWPERTEVAASCSKLQPSSSPSPPSSPSIASGANGSHQQSVEDWLKELESDKTYQGINVRAQYGKMLNWCKVNKKEATKRRFVNWLNRSEKSLPLQHAARADYKRNYVEAPQAPEISDYQRKRILEIAAEEKAKLKEQLGR